MKSIILLLSTLLCLGLNAEKLTIEKFLLSADYDFILKNHSELVDYHNNSSGSTPFFDKIEFRAELEDFDRFDQQYSLRFYPKGWGETKSSRNIASLMKEENKMEHEEYYNNALGQRYELILSYVETSALIEHYKKLQTVYNDRITVLNKLAETAEEFDVVEIISAEDKLIDLQLDLVKLEDILTNLTHKIGVIAGKDIEVAFDEKSIIDIRQIKKQLPQVKKVSGIENISIRNRKLKIELAKSKYELEVAKTRDYISFFKLDYKTQDYKEPNKSFSIGIGLKLPFINPEKDEINERKARHIEEKLKLEDTLRRNQETVISITRSMNRMFAQYDILSQRKESGNAATSFKKYMEMDGINPITLLKLKESMLEGDIRLIKIKTNIRMKYIRLLNELGELSEKPIKNHLSPGREKLDGK